METSLDLAQQLKTVPVFSELGGEELAWLAERMEVLHYNPGDMGVAEGGAADRMWVLLVGEVRGQREHAVGDGRIFLVCAPQVTGLLPYSRLTHVPLTIRAVAPTTIASLHSTYFQTMLERIPALGPKLVGIMSDR